MNQIAVTEWIVGEYLFWYFNPEKGGWTIKMVFANWFDLRDCDLVTQAAQALAMTWEQVRNQLARLYLTKESLFWDDEYLRLIKILSGNLSPEQRKLCSLDCEGPDCHALVFAGHRPCCSRVTDLDQAMQRCIDNNGRVPHNATGRVRCPLGVISGSVPE